MSSRPPSAVNAAYLRVSVLSSQIRRISASGAPAETSAAAIASADGRSDTEPKAYLSPDPIAEPSSSAISSERILAWSLARLASA